jgi:hypothetical protein
MIGVTLVWVIRLGYFNLVQFICFERLEHLIVDWKIIQERILRKQGGCQIDSSYSGQ